MVICMIDNAYTVFGNAGWLACSWPPRAMSHPREHTGGGHVAMPGREMPIQQRAFLLGVGCGNECWFLQITTLTTAEPRGRGVWRAMAGASKVVIAVGMGTPVLQQSELWSFELYVLVSWVRQNFKFSSFHLAFIDSWGHCVGSQWLAGASHW